MSEKLYLAEKAVELLDGDNPIPARYLVFDGPVKVFFPEDRTTLFFQGDLYDWYGRKVQLPYDIHSVIGPYGYEDFGQCYAQESFLVKLKNQRLALANLTYPTDYPQFPWQETTSYRQHKYKHKLLHGILAAPPKLELRNWSFQRLVDFSQVGFDSRKLHDYVAFVGVTGKATIIKNQPSFKGHYKGQLHDTDIPSIWFTCGPTYDCPVEHNIAESRETILRYPSPFLFSNCPEHVITNYLVGDLTFSEDNTKLSAYSPIPDKTGNNRISTDAEMLNHCLSGNKICWYYDPLP